MRRFLILGLGLVMLLGLCGCSQELYAPVVKGTQPLTIAEVAGSRLVASTVADTESEAYTHASDRVVLTSDSLLTVSGADLENIQNLMSNVAIQLSGAGGAVLSDTQAGYLLTEFARSKYMWEQSKLEVVGYDPATRYYFVDVTYRTTDEIKGIILDSRIPNGAENASALRQKRYADYLTLLSLKSVDSSKYAFKLAEFTTVWGSLEDIFAEQQGLTLYDRTLLLHSDETTYSKIVRLTYSGLIRNSNLSGAAEMTVRYVLTYSMNLGEETDLSVVVLYVKDFGLVDAESLLSGYEFEDATSLEILKPFMDNLILSHLRCVEASNSIGLSSLFYNYGALDKYYDELRDLAYIASGGYTFEVIGRQDRHLFVKVTLSNQIRGRDSEMTLPTYTDVLVYDIFMGQDDTLYLYSTSLVSRELVGEPVSVVRNVVGVSDKISYSAAAFSESNREQVEQLLKDFSQVVANGDVSSSKFLECVDLGISKTTLSRMVDTIKAITPNRLVTYVVSWGTRTNVYCSVTVREVFECENGAFDTEAVISMCNGDNGWRITGYSRNLSVKTALTDLDTSTAFCVSQHEADVPVTAVGNVTGHTAVEVVTPESSVGGSVIDVETSVDVSVDVDVDAPGSGVDVDVPVGVPVDTPVDTSEPTGVVDEFA